MRRLFWVAVGAAAGVYAMRRVQTVVYSYSPAGLTDRAAGAGESVRALLQEIGGRMAERESDLRQALGMTGDDHDEGSFRTIRHRGDGAGAGAGDSAGAADPSRALGHSRPALSPAAAADLIDHPASDQPASGRHASGRPASGRPGQNHPGAAGNPDAGPGTGLPRSST